jgi:acetyl-CoA carboxylase biotin carboxyl carrier protein
VANVEAHITGTVWKIEVEVGDTVEEGDTVVILESMKMEMPVEAEDEGTVKEILCEEGQSVTRATPSSSSSERARPGASCGWIVPRRTSRG